MATETEDERWEMEDGTHCVRFALYIFVFNYFCAIFELSVVVPYSRPSPVTIPSPILIPIPILIPK